MNVHTENLGLEDNAWFSGPVRTKEPRRASKESTGSGALAPRQRRSAGVAVWVVGLGFLLLSTGCVPWPHFRTVTPAITGHLLLSGEPASDIRVVQSFAKFDHRCAEASRQTRTDSEGRFEFPPLRRFLWYITLSDDYHEVQICIEHEGGLVSIFRGWAIDEPKFDTAEIRCELTLVDADAEPLRQEKACEIRRRQGWSRSRYGTESFNHVDAAPSSSGDGIGGFINDKENFHKLSSK